QFPRDKPCGGGISVRAGLELPIDPGPVVERGVDSLELSFRGGRAFRRGGARQLASLTQRRRLDHFLIEQATAAGAEFREGAGVSEASENGARVNGEWIGAELLIGADGANGSTARYLGLSHTPTYGVAFEGNLACQAAELGRWPSTVVIELGTVPGGYCWIFPKGDHLNIGVGGWEQTGPMLRSYLKEFCRQRGFEYSSLRDLRGYRLPGRQPGDGSRDEASRRPRDGSRLLRATAGLRVRPDVRIRVEREDRAGSVSPSFAGRGAQPTRMAHPREHASRRDPRARARTRDPRPGRPRLRTGRQPARMARRRTPRRGDDVAAESPAAGRARVRESSSAPGKIRTCDLSLRRRALYPLSYGRGSVECIGHASRVASSHRSGRQAAPVGAGCSWPGAPRQGSAEARSRGSVRRWATA